MQSIHASIPFKSLKLSLLRTKKEKTSLSAQNKIRNLIDHYPVLSHYLSSYLPLSTHPSNCTLAVKRSRLMAKTVKPSKNPESHTGRMARGQGRVGTWQRYGQLSRFLPLATCQSDIELSIRRRGTFAPLSEVCVFRAFPLRSPWIESAIKKLHRVIILFETLEQQFIVEPLQFIALSIILVWRWIPIINYRNNIFNFVHLSIERLYSSDFNNALWILEAGWIDYEKESSFCRSM